MSDTKNIYQRINAIMKDVRGVGKHSRNPQGNYNYAGHEAVTEALHDAYVKHGVVRLATVEKSEVLERGTVSLMVRVSWVATDHDSRIDVLIPALQSSVKKDGGLAPVQVGMALSYAVKNAEFKCFALTGDDTPDTEESDNDREDTSHFAKDTGEEWLKKFDEAKTLADITKISDGVKKAWDTLKTIPGFSETVVARRNAATARVRGYDNGRQPGQEG